MNTSFITPNIPFGEETLKLSGGEHLMMKATPHWTNREFFADVSEPSF